MPGSLVPAVEPVYVPLSRRCLLPGRIPRLRASRTRIVSVQPQNRRWKDFYQSRRDADSRSRGEHEARRSDMRLIQKIGEWFDLRLQLGASIRETAQHPVPRETASWFYVFGSAALTCFTLQIVTGILLALICAFCRRGVEQPPDSQS